MSYNYHDYFTRQAASNLALANGLAALLRKEKPDRSIKVTGGEKNAYVWLSNVDKYQIRARSVHRLHKLGDGQWVKVRSYDRKKVVEIVNGR